jgi:uncharacterized protein YegJ (DUF2314 family)
MNAALPETYTGVFHFKARPPSWLIAVLPADAEMPAMGAILDRLEDADLDLRFETVATEATVPEARWEVEISASRDEEGEEGSRLGLSLWMQPAADLLALHVEWQALPPEQQEAARSALWAIGVSCTLGRRPLEDFHRQLRVLATIAPEAVIILDAAACRAHSPGWLIEATATSIPPNPAYLFTIHAVRDESQPGSQLWLHTHGLLRCGSIELELFEVQEDHVQILVELLGASARLFIESGPPEPGATFEVGPGIELIWLPWETVAKRPPRTAFIEQIDRDETHRLPSGVLLTPPQRRLLGLWPGRPGNPERYVPRLTENPVLFVSDQETDRMTRLARSRLSSFASIYSRYHETNDWVFMVKLSYDIDGATSPEECEHLWFEVHDISDDQIEATLANQPNRIDRMQEGDRDTHPISRLRDWVILSPHGRFDPDTVAHLERVLSAEHEA